MKAPHSKPRRSVAVDFCARVPCHIRDLFFADGSWLILFTALPAKSPSNVNCLESKKPEVLSKYKRTRCGGVSAGQANLHSQLVVEQNQICISTGVQCAFPFINSQCLAQQGKCSAGHGAALFTGRQH